MIQSVSCRSLLAVTFSASLAAGFGACVEPDAGEGVELSTHTLTISSEYAESVYRNYQEASGTRISFELSALKAGRLDEIAAIPANDLLDVPATWLRMTPRGTEILEIVRETRDPAPGSDEWQQRVDLRQLENMGRPMAEGSYRILSVTATLGADVASHKALELCWAKDSYCLVMDPVVLQADAYLHERQRLLAEGWEPEVNALAASPAQSRAASGVCALNSDSGKSSISFSYPAYEIAHKNIFGMTVVRKEMGEQTVGLACYVNGAGACVGSGFGYSRASSCKASFGYSCDCDNTGNLVGVSSDGTVGRAWSETRCTHRAILSASVSFSVQGTGANFGVTWDTAGSVDASGGQLYDSCAFYVPTRD